MESEGITVFRWLKSTVSNRARVEPVNSFVLGVVSMRIVAPLKVLLKHRPNSNNVHTESTFDLLHRLGASRLIFNFEEQSFCSYDFLIAKFTGLFSC